MEYSQSGRTVHTWKDFSALLSSQKRLSRADLDPCPVWALLSVLVQQWQQQPMLWEQPGAGLPRWGCASGAHGAFCLHSISPGRGWSEGRSWGALGVVCTVHCCCCCYKGNIKLFNGARRLQWKGEIQGRQVIIPLGEGGVLCPVEPRNMRVMASAGPSNHGGMNWRNQQEHREIKANKTLVHAAAPQL